MGGPPLRKKWTRVSVPDRNGWHASACWGSRRPKGWRISGALLAERGTDFDATARHRTGPKRKDPKPGGAQRPPRRPPRPSHCSTWPVSRRNLANCSSDRSGQAPVFRDGWREEGGGAALGDAGRFPCLGGGVRPQRGARARGVGLPGGVHLRLAVLRSRGRGLGPALQGKPLRAAFRLTVWECNGWPLDRDVWEVWTPPPARQGAGCQPKIVEKSPILV